MKSAAFLETFVAYPPSPPPASFLVDQIVENVKKQIEQLKQKR
jgi:arylsulfatase